MVEVAAKLNLVRTGLHTAIPGECHERASVLTGGSLVNAGHRTAVAERLSRELDTADLDSIHRVLGVRYLTAADDDIWPEPIHRNVRLTHAPIQLV